MLQIKNERTRVFLQRHPSVAEVTATRLLEIANLIQKRPDHFDMADWWVGPDHIATRYNEGDEFQCNSAGCIAGWACYLNSQTITALDVEEEARQLLGLTWEESKSLFYTESWPDPHMQRWDEAMMHDPGDRDTLARIAVERIHHFIMKGE